MITNKELGRRVALIREEMEMTQSELAEKLCMSQSKLSRVEQGTRALTPTELQRLREHAPVDRIDDLFVEPADEGDLRTDRADEIQTPDIDEEALERAGLTFDRHVPEVVHMGDDYMVLQAEGFPRKALANQETRDRFRSVFERSIVEVVDASEAGYPGADYALRLGRKRLTSISYDEFETNVERRPEQVFIGQDKAGRCIEHTIEEMTHLLVAGEAESGKSVAIRQIMTRLLETTEHMDMGVIDLKGGVEYAEYVDASDALDVHDSRARAIDFLKWANSTMDDRLAVMKEQGVTNLSDISDDERQKKPRIAIVIDEFAELFATPNTDDAGAEYQQAAAQEAKRLVSRIVRFGRAPGVHLVLATQRPTRDVLPMQIRDNLPTRIVGSMANKSAAHELVDCSVPTRIKPQRGIFLYKRGAVRRLVQVPLLGNDESVERIQQAESASY